MLSNYEREMRNRMKSSEIKKLEKTLSEIRDIEPQFESYNSSDFLRETQQLKNALAEGKTLEDILPRAYALALTAIRKQHPGHFELRDVQVMSSIALHYGTCVELGTGEGKTVSAVLPAFLNALAGKKVHIASSNNYLSKRDLDELKPIYEMLGVHAAYVPEELGNATIEMLKENKRQKKEAYSADICYASNTTFAFDYLRDSTTMNKDDLVLNPNDELGFALIDEVDDILLDNAKIPFIISEQEKVYEERMTVIDLARTLEVPIQDILSKIPELKMNINYLTPLTYDQAQKIASLYHVELLTSELKYQRYADQFVRNMLYQEGPMTEKSTFYDCDIDKEKSIQTFEILKSNPYENFDISYEEQKRLADILNSKNLIMRSVTQGKKDFYLTERGYRAFENYFFRIYLSENKSLLSTIAPQIIRDERFKNGIDYYIGEGNNLFLTEIGIEKATKLYSAIKQIRERFAVSNEYARILQLVQTSVDVYLNYRENKEYSVTTDAKGKMTVQVITGGRIAPGRVFGKGAQQAVEIKEKVKRRERSFNISKESRTKASITQKGFYSRYQKLSGMSGTSSIDAFGKLYNLRTIEMPRSAHYEYYSDTKRKKIEALIRKGKMTEQDYPKCPKKVIQHPDTFYPMEQQKYEAIYKSIIESQNKKVRQPILITTTSVKESEKLAEFLKNKGVNFQLLNALTAKEKEAEIIAKAGEIGRITISTEMAGRGTDIKLGGDRDKTIEIAMLRFYQRNPKLQNCSEDQKRRFREQMENALEQQKVILPADRQKQIHDLLSENGGLKVICDGHFNYERIDNQVKGRTGRGGEGGEIQFFSSPEDFIRMGTSKERVQNLFMRLQQNNEKAINALNKELKTIQAINEEELIKHIEDTQELDTIVSLYRNKLRTRRSELVLGYEKKEKDGVSIKSKIDYKQEIDDILSKVIRNMIITHIPNGITHKSFSFNAKEAGLDIESFALDLEATLGIRVKPEVLYQFENLKEIKDVATNIIQEYHNSLIEKNPKKQEEIDREVLLSYYDRVLDASADILEDMEFQKRLDDMVGYENKSHPVLFFDTYMEGIERECLVDSIQVGYGKKLSSEQQQKLDESKMQRKERIQSEDYMHKENQEIKKMEQEQVKKEQSENQMISYQNLQIRESNVIVTLLGTAVQLVKAPVKLIAKIPEKLQEIVEEVTTRKR